MALNFLDIYGQSLWHTLHTFSANYKPENKIFFIQFVESFKRLIPCPKCRNSFSAHLKSIPLEKYLDNRKSVLVWSYLVHNEVNEKLGKKSPPFKDVLRFYINE